MCAHVVVEEVEAVAVADAAAVASVEEAGVADEAYVDANP